MSNHVCQMVIKVAKKSKFFSVLREQSTAYGGKNVTQYAINGKITLILNILPIMQKEFHKLNF